MNAINQFGKRIDVTNYVKKNTMQLIKAQE